MDDYSKFEDDHSPSSHDAEEPAGGKKKKRFVVGVIALAVLIVVVGYFKVSPGQRLQSSLTAATPTATTAVIVPPLVALNPGESFDATAGYNEITNPKIHDNIKKQMLFTADGPEPCIGRDPTQGNPLRQITTLPYNEFIQRQWQVVTSWPVSSSGFVPTGTCYTIIYDTNQGQTTAGFGMVDGEGLSNFYYPLTQEGGITIPIGGTNYGIVRVSGVEVAANQIVPTSSSGLLSQGTQRFYVFRPASIDVQLDPSTASLAGASPITMNLSDDIEGIDVNYPNVLLNNTTSSPAEFNRLLFVNYTLSVSGMPSGVRADAAIFPQVTARPLTVAFDQSINALRLKHPDCDGYNPCVVKIVFTAIPLPTRISNFRSTAQTANSITLNWDIPAGTTIPNQIESFELRHQVEDIGESNFTGATLISCTSPSCTPTDGTTAYSQTVTGFNPNTHFFAIRSVGSVENVPTGIVKIHALQAVVTPSRADLFCQISGTSYASCPSEVVDGSASMGAISENKWTLLSHESPSGGSCIPLPSGFNLFSQSSPRINDITSGRPGLFTFTPTLNTNCPSIIYKLQLRVGPNGNQDVLEPPLEVSITTVPTPLISGAPLQAIQVGTSVTLSGSTSRFRTDISGALIVNPINGTDDRAFTWASYSWAGIASTFVSLPATPEIATFNAQTEGVYSMVLTVTDAGGGTHNAAPVQIFANQPPTASFIMSPATAPYNGGSPIALTSTSTDPRTVSMGSLVHNWDIYSPPTEPTPLQSLVGQTVNYTPLTTGNYLIRLLVTDSLGASAQIERTITVTPPPNVPPGVAITGPVSGTIGTPISLSAAVSDPDVGQTHTLTWTFMSQPTGSTLNPALGTGTITSFTPTHQGNYVVEISVDDGAGGVGQDEITITIIPNAAPAASFTRTPDCDPCNKGTLITFDASDSTDPNGDPISFTWLYEEGPGPNPPVPDNTAVFSFTPTAEGEYTYSFIVKDNRTPPAQSASTNVGVNIVNRQPVANAGTDRTVTVGTTVTLNGSASSDPDAMDVLTYAWSQTAGPAVTLASSSDITPSFTPTAEGSYIFSLTVTDNDSQNRKSSTDTVSITVNALPPPPNAAPTLEDPADRTISEDAPQQTLTLTGISAGPASESTQTITNIDVRSNNVSLIPHPTINQASPPSPATRTLTFTPISNQSGTAEITITVRDDGGIENNGVNTVSQTFTVTVNEINDSPNLDYIPNPNPIPQNSPEQSIDIEGISEGPNESAQTLTINAVSDNTTLIPSATVTYIQDQTAGTVTFTPAQNQSGTATITVIVQDNGGTALGGFDTFRRTFIVTVTPIAAACGNSLVEGTEQCDDGNTVDTDTCSNTCIIVTHGAAPVCGNNLVETPEQCDDGNTVPNDGCSSTCGTETPILVCGNGIVEGTEQCDDGNTSNTDACLSTCTNATFLLPKNLSRITNLSDTSAGSSWLEAIKRFIGSYFSFFTP